MCALGAQIREFASPKKPKGFAPQRLATMRVEAEETSEILAVLAVTSRVVV